MTDAPKFDVMEIVARKRALERAEAEAHEAQAQREREQAEEVTRGDEKLHELHARAQDVAGEMNGPLSQGGLELVVGPLSALAPGSPRLFAVNLNADGKRLGPHAQFFVQSLSRITFKIAGGSQSREIVVSADQADTAFVERSLTEFLQQAYPAS